MIVKPNYYFTVFPLLRQISCGIRLLQKEERYMEDQQTYVNKKGLTVKDLVTVGIFTAIIWLTMLIGGLPFAPNPVLTFYMPLGSALLGGPVFLLLVAKAPKRGVIAIVGILIAVIWFALGMHWAMGVGYAVGGIAGELVAGTGKYRSVKINIIAFCCLSLGATGSYICYFIDPVGWYGYMLNGGTEANYLDTMNTVSGYWMLAVMLIGTVIVAAFSGWVGSKLLKKQFEKAGITA
jgi:energy-coupling factor transport system substrate-specific component